MFNIDNLFGLSFKLFIGIVAIDKPYNQRLIKVYIPELYPFYEDKELSDTTITESETINTVNSEEEIKVNTSNIITAEYLDVVSNRTFPPDVRKGEYVLILKFNDNDVFYWIPLSISDNLRRLEVLRFSISNDQRVNKELNEDNTYYIELDTLHKKSIILRTSKSDGESFRYLIHIDAKNSEVIIEDDDDNYIILQSEVPRIKLHNKNNSFIDINQDDIFLNAPRDFRMKVGRMTYLETESLVINNQNAIVVNTDNLGIKSENTTLKASTIGMDGSVKISETLVTNAIRSGSYGTGSVGSMPTSPEANTDIHNGTTTTPHNTPDEDDSIGTMRHSAAYEQMKQALEIIANCFSEIDSKIGIGCNYSSLPNIGEQSKMKKNKGE